MMWPEGMITRYTEPTVYEYAALHNWNSNWRFDLIAIAAALKRAAAGWSLETCMPCTIAEIPCCDCAYTPNVVKRVNLRFGKPEPMEFKSCEPDEVDHTVEDMSRRITDLQQRLAASERARKAAQVCGSCKHWHMDWVDEYRCFNKFNSMHKKSNHETCNKWEVIE
jgi:hypothetical protein